MQGAPQAPDLLLDLLAILWPCACVACGAPNRDICANCHTELGQAAGKCTWVDTPAGVGACVAGPYAGPLRALLVGFKHGGRTGFGRALGAQLRAPLRAALSLARSPVPLVVTVPSRPDRVRERGYRHVDVMVRHALRGMHARGDPRPLLLSGALRALPGRTGQVGLSTSERMRNASLVRVPRTMRGRLRGREVVLVDDIITTGATVLASAEALEAAGANVVAVVGLCATERRHRAQPVGDQNEFSDNTMQSPDEVEVDPREAIRFEKGVKVRPALWPPA